MPKYYFTYGKSGRHPYTGGWTEIEAPDEKTARSLFQAYHPNRPERGGQLDCAGVYTEEAFAASSMSGPHGNWEAFCQEIILVHREEFGPKNGGGG